MRPQADRGRKSVRFALNGLSQRTKEGKPGKVIDHESLADTLIAQFFVQSVQRA